MSGDLSRVHFPDCGNSGTRARLRVGPNYSICSHVVNILCIIINLVLIKEV